MLALFLINVQLYSKNHKNAFLSHSMGGLGNISALSKSWRFSNGLGPLKHKFQVKLVSEKQNDCPLILYQNIGRMFFRFVTKHVCDGERDGRTELRSPIPRSYSCTAR